MIKSRKWLVPVLEIAILCGVAAVAYMPRIVDFGYYNDDWYSMYAAKVAGSDIFHEMYAIDRPGRAYVMQPLYDLFHGIPVFYNISAVILRVLGALALLWVLRLLWKTNRATTFIVALFFLIYPGFLSMPNAIDFQSHLIGILLAFISLGLGLWGVQHETTIIKVVAWIGAMATGWAYLSQMEYYLGFEIVRIVLFVLLAWRGRTPIRKSLIQFFRSWIPYAIIPLLYLIWRVFLFNNVRVTTDISGPIDQIVHSPLVTLYGWIINSIQSIINVVFLAWGVPLYQQAFTLPISDAIRGLLVSAVIAVCFMVALALTAGRGSPNQDISPTNWRGEMVISGIAWTIAGLLIVVFADRSVTFPAYSRYGLVSAGGAILALVASISYLSDKRIQYAILGLMVFSAIFTHYANGWHYARFANDLRAFWWQVSWRIPQMEKGTSLIARYPNGGIIEDSSVWGPANLIYYPIRIDPNRVQAGVYAILLDNDAVVKVLSREGQVYRKHIIVDTYRNYRNVLILTQPTTASCVQVIDGSQPMFSRYEDPAIVLIGIFSEPQHILTTAISQIPPESLFQEEPKKGWCYYYEKASLAKQKGDWDTVLLLGDEVTTKGFAPGDLIEWMPFLEAWVRNDHQDKVRQISEIMAGDTYIAGQACKILGGIPDLPPDTANSINEVLCSPN
jgi:hypothetical protein